jgi:DNA-binding NarL/FixJ family response regulator
VLPPADTSRRLRALAAHRDQDWHGRVLRERLTPREQEVLERLAQGAGHDEIARDLVISPETAQTHIRNLLGKLGVRSRLEAVIKALRLGLVPPPS